MDFFDILLMLNDNFTLGNVKHVQFYNFYYELIYEQVKLK